MGVDIRMPIGLFFLILGGLLSIYGLYTALAGRSEMYQRSQGINVNLWWGLCLLAFGAAMAWFARRATRRAGPPPERTPPERPPAADGGVGA